MLNLISHKITYFILRYVMLLLARLESAYSLIWGARDIWGKSGGETLALL